ncbi:hypothetical protein L6255_03425 [Candidatus Parcubacteria bacterium]|nr:hypothetical protein [Patescibacteria group bacterium]MBU4380943.1 hypothetical protein [Patescibacteria group bacterium]MCG2689461.1 hypothetical protein [Candidatus Parcubacteria bacterium]
MAFLHMPGTKANTQGLLPSEKGIHRKIHPPTLGRGVFSKSCYKQTNFRLNALDTANYRVLPEVG